MSTETAPRIVHQSPDGQIVVLRHGPRRYERLVAGESRGFFTALYQAQHVEAAEGPAARVAAVMAPDAEADLAAQAEALLSWLAEDPIAPWVAGRLWDLAAFMVASGRGIIRAAPRDDSLAPVLYAALERAAADWGGDWRRAQAATHLIGGEGERVEATTGPAAAELPAVAERPFFGDEPTPQGVEYVANTSDGEVYAYISHGSYPHVEVWGDKLSGVRIEHIEAILPALLALVADPRVKAARRAKAATCQDQRRKAA